MTTLIYQQNQNRALQFLRSAKRMLAPMNSHFIMHDIVLEQLHRDLDEIIGEVKNSWNEFTRRCAVSALIQIVRVIDRGGNPTGRRNDEDKILHEVCTGWATEIQGYSAPEEEKVA